MPKGTLDVWGGREGCMPKCLYVMSWYDNGLHAACLTIMHQQGKVGQCLSEYVLEKAQQSSQVRYRVPYREYKNYTKIE